MQTLLALEELIRSYNGITALDNFKAMEAIKVLKELDLKYEGFGEDKEISPKRILEEFLKKEDDNTVSASKRYISFSPVGYSIIRQSGNCLVELQDSVNSFYISDKQICLFYEMISDIFEYGEINETSNWKSSDLVSEIKVHDISNETNCIISITYDENICQLLNKQNKFDELINRSTEVVLDVDTLHLAKLMRRILLNYRSQEMVMISLPEKKRINYSEALKQTLSSVRYFNVLTRFKDK